MNRICFYIVIINVFYCANIFAAEKLNVFVSILPQKYFVEQVGKELVDVQVMIGPGQNPTTYEPTPRQMVQISKAKIYFSIGVPFENAWLPKVRKNNKNLVIVDCCESLIDTSITPHQASEHDVFHSDPHIWSSPIKVIQLVEQITEQLVAIDTSNTELYRKSATVFIQKLLELDSEIKTKTKGLIKRDLIVSHPSWSYFAREYGFVQIPIEQNGKEIQASAMVHLIEDAKQKKIKAVFVQPQFNNKAAEVIAQEIGAKLIMLDPLAMDYIANMQEVTEKIVEGLSYE